MKTLYDIMAEKTAEDRGTYWSDYLRSVPAIHLMNSLTSSLCRDLPFSGFEVEGTKLRDFVNGFAIAVSGGNYLADNMKQGSSQSKGLIRMNSGSYGDMLMLAGEVDPEIIVNPPAWTLAAVDPYLSMRMGFDLAYYFAHDTGNIPMTFPNRTAKDDLLVLSKLPELAYRSTWFLTSCILLGTESIEGMFRLTIDVLDATEAFKSISGVLFDTPPVV